MEEIPEKYRNDLAIIQDTVLQINRDIGITGVEVILSGNEKNAFGELREQLKSLIEGLNKSDKISLHSLLYKIDISEKEYRSVLQNENKTALSERLAELIIHREFQKVLTRRYFSNNSKK